MKGKELVKLLKKEGWQLAKVGKPIMGRRKND